MAMMACTARMPNSIERCAGIRYRLCFLDRARDQGMLKTRLITSTESSCLRFLHMLIVSPQAFLDQRGEDYDDCPDSMRLVS